MLTYTILSSLAASFASAQNVSTTEELISAVRDGAEGRKIQIGPGIFELPGPLELKTGMTLQGTGMRETVITHTADWKPSTEALPKGEIRLDEANPQAYLIRLRDKAVNITISNLTLRGPQLHGAIFVKAALRVFPEIPFPKTARRVAEWLQDLGNRDLFTMKMRVKIFYIPPFGDPQGIATRHQGRS